MAEVWTLRSMVRALGHCQITHNSLFYQKRHAAQLDRKQPLIFHTRAILLFSIIADGKLKLAEGLA